MAQIQKKEPPELGRYAEGLTQWEIKKLVEAEVGTQLERLEKYYRRGYPTFNMMGGHDLEQHDLAEFEIDTESGQGILFTNTGNCKILGNASVEVISNGKKNAGAGFNKKSDAGIVIYSKDGVIHIETLHGDITIRSSNNVNIDA